MFESSRAMAILYRPVSSKRQSIQAENVRAAIVKYAWICSVVIRPTGGCGFWSELSFWFRFKSPVS